MNCSYVLFTFRGLVGIGLSSAQKKQRSNIEQPSDLTIKVNLPYI